MRAAGENRWSDAHGRRQVPRANRPGQQPSQPGPTDLSRPARHVRTGRSAHGGLELGAGHDRG